MMSNNENIDHKLFNLPRILVQNLDIEPPPGDIPTLSDLCKLPEVHLEKLDLGMSTSTPSPPRIPLPRVVIQRLNLNLIQPLNVASTSFSAERNDEPGIPAFTKIPVVVLHRCDASKRPQKRVSFQLPTSKPTYTTIGPHRHVSLRTCYVRVRRDDLEKLKSSLKVEKPSSCKLCGKVYFSQKKLNYHQERKHDLVSSGVVAEKKKRVSFSNEVIVHTMPYHRCRKCLKIFETYKVLKLHMRSQHRKRDKYICDYCDKLFADRMIFKIHIKLHCNNCTLLFPDRKELQAHKRTVCIKRKIRKIKCNACNDVFFSNLALKDHSYTHLNEKILVCDVCKDHFLTRCQLIPHLRTHENRDGATLKNYAVIKKGSINICKSSTEEKDISHHLNITTSNKRQTSKNCLIKFSTEKQMLEHTWMHVDDNSSNKTKSVNGIRENGISETFDIRRASAKTSEELTNNFSVQVTTNGNPEGTKANGNTKKRALKEKKIHFCPICNKSFTRSSSLRRHSAVHNKSAPSSSEPLQCAQCEEVFAWPALLRDHTCLRSRYIEEVPIIPPEYPVPTLNVFAMEEEFPITNDVTTHIDFEIPAPNFEFASVPQTIPQVYSATSNTTTKGYRYKVIRQEVPIEF